MEPGGYRVTFSGFELKHAIYSAGFWRNKNSELYWLTHHDMDTSKKTFFAATKNGADENT